MSALGKLTALPWTPQLFSSGPLRGRRGMKGRARGGEWR